jgi:multidrug efflux system outer membrane protein
MKYRQHLNVIVLLALLTGCAVGPDFQRQAPPAPANYVYDSLRADTLMNLAWWELFQDPALKQLIDTGLKYNRSTLIAAARVEQARAYLGTAKASQWPSFYYQGVAEATNLNQTGSATGDARFPGNAGINMLWELDFWGKYRRANEAARAELFADQHAQRQVLISLIGAITSTYFDLLDYQTRLEIAKSTFKLRKESTAIISERYKEGIIPEIDLEQARMHEEDAAFAIPQYERLVAATMHTLSILLGRSPGKIPADGMIYSRILPPDIPPGIPSNLLTRRPDLMEAEELWHAQTAEIGMAQAMRFPSISLTAMLGAVSPDLASISTGGFMFWSAAGGIFGPIFEFNKNKRRVEYERAQALQAGYYYENAVLQAFREVEDALVSIETYRRQNQSVSKSYTSATNAANLSRHRYDGGVTSYLEVLESDRSAFSVALQASETYTSLLNSYVALYKALGGGWISPEEKQQTSSSQ